MPQHLYDLLAPKDHDQANRFYGVAVGIVTNNQDPNNLGRVKVKFPWLDDNVESPWARVVCLMGGNGRGTYFIPEVNDEVLLAFDQGDMSYPYVLGGLWNGKDAPPANNSDGQNNIRVIHSRSGHLIRLDDTNGDEKVEIIDKTGGNSVTISSSDNSIHIVCTGRLSLQANGIDITSQSDINIQASSTLGMSSSATMTITGEMVSIN